MNDRPSIDASCGDGHHHRSESRPADHPPGARRVLAEVKANEPLGTMFRLTVVIPGISEVAPGRFAMLQAEHSQSFLARAISVSGQRGEEISFFIAPIGDATRELCALRSGDRLWVLGPLGKGFDVDALVMSPERAVLVAGGAGVAPFPLLLDRMRERYRTLSSASKVGRFRGPGGVVSEVLVLLGFRNDAQAGCAAPVKEAAARMEGGGVHCRLEVAVEDGSRGPAVKASDLLARHLRPGDRLAVCGPDAMLAAVWGVCSAVGGVRAWFSLEGKMACGVGSCHGCLIGLADGTSARVCHDGPVFLGREVFGA